MTYATVQQLKDRLGKESGTDNAILEMVLTASTNAIVSYCGRSFQADTVASDRYFTARESYRLVVDEFTELTNLYSDSDGDRSYSQSWANEWELLPAISPPYDTIYPRPSSTLDFGLTARAAYRVNAKWGYSTSPPDEIIEACLILAMRLYKAPDYLGGVAGNADVGTLVSRYLPGQDNDFRVLLLDPLRRVSEGLNDGFSY